MACSSVHLTVTHTSAPAEGFSRVFQNTLNAIVYWPVLLFTLGVHLLCQPATRKFLLALVVLDIPLEWGTHFSFRSDAAAFGAIEGFDCSITTLSLCGLYIGWLFAARATNQWPRIAWSWPIATYTAIVIVSIFVSADPQLSLFQIFLLIEMLFLYIYVAGNIESRSELVFLLLLLLAGEILESLYMVTVAGIGHDFGFVRALGIKTQVEVTKLPGDFIRQGGTVGSPNYSAGYLEVLIALAISVRQIRVPDTLRRLTIPAILCGIVALATTFSRGGWLGLMLSMAILGSFGWARRGLSRKWVLAAAVLILLCLFIPNPISKRLSDDDNGSAHSRVPLMNLAYRMIAANPVLGVGANNFAIVMNDYAGSEFRHEWIYTVHNEFLLVCSETGFIGLAAYLWIYFSLIHRSWRMWKSRDALFAPLGLGIIAGTCGILSHMFVDIFSGRPLMQLVWLFMAMISGCEMILLREKAELPVPPYLEQTA